jgi:hypothetical protein
MRLFSTSCFAAALSGCLLMRLAGVPESLMYLALLSVTISAILSNLMWLRSMGLVGIGGLSLVFSQLSGQNLAGMLLTVVIAVLLGTAAVSMIFADVSHSSK